MRQIFRAIPQFLMALAFSVFISVESSNGATIYVNESIQPGGDGQSWITAFDSLYDGLGAAGFGDEVWVASGTYQVNSAARFEIPNGVAVLGGFIGNETSSDQRDWVANPTIITITSKGGGLFEITTPPPFRQEWTDCASSTVVINPRTPIYVRSVTRVESE